MQITKANPTKKSVIHVVLIWTVLMILFLVHDSHAFQNYACEVVGEPYKWDGNKTTMYIYTPSFPIGGDEDRALQNAMWHWNNVNGSNFQFIVSHKSDGKILGNLMNEIYRSTDISDETALAVTTFYGPPCYMICPPLVCDKKCPLDPPGCCLTPWRPPLVPWECVWKASFTEADIVFNAAFLGQRTISIIATQLSLPII